MSSDAAPAARRAPAPAVASPSSDRGAAAPSAGTPTGLILGAACLAAACLASMDPTTLSALSPRIAEDLGASPGQAQWIVNAFLLALSVLLVPAGTLAARIGELRMLRVGMAVLGLGALGATLAPSVGVLVASRAVEGAGAAAMIPSAMALFRRSFPVERQAFALGLFSGIGASGAAFGPIVAGAIIEFAPWRAVFALVAGIAAVVLVLLSRTVAPARMLGDPSPSYARINVALGIGLTALVWALIRAGGSGWSDVGVLAGLLGGLLVVGLVLGHLVRGVRRSPDRADVSLGSFGVLGAILVAVSVTTFGMIFLLSGFLQRVHDYSSFEVGLALLGFLLTASVLMPVGGRLARHVSARALLVAGTALSAAGLVLLTRVSVDGGVLDDLPAVVVVGVGNALIMPTLLNGFVSSAAPAHGAITGALQVCVNQVGGILGIALLGSIVAGGLAPRYSAALTEAGVRRPATPEMVATLASSGPVAVVDVLPAGVPAAPAVRSGRQAYADASVHGLRWAAAWGILSFVLAAGLGGRIRSVAGDDSAATADPRPATDDLGPRIAPDPVTPNADGDAEKAGTVTV